MRCHDFKELVPALALGTLDQAEAAACAAHLASKGPHDGCHPAEQEARLLAARLSDALPDHPVNPRVWRAIENRVQAEAQARPRPHRWRQPSLGREVAGWTVAALVFVLYLFKGTSRDGERAEAPLLSSPQAERATTLTLMMAPEMQRYLFQPAQTGTARAALFFDPGSHNAVVLIDRIGPTPPGQGLHLWAVRTSGAAPALLSRIGPASAGMAAAEVGNKLFELGLPGKLLLSCDPSDASSPGSVLMVANLAH
jgi:anti-sigma-K factor RskA